jgi:hypothetical protein
MDYTTASVGSLLRGPLLHTPQGWICVVTLITYIVVAIAVVLFGASAPFAKTTSAALVLCATWPFITLLFWIKGSQPSFASSWAKAVWLLVVGVAPIAFGYWRANPI